MPLMEQRWMSWSTLNFLFTFILTPFLHFFSFHVHTVFGGQSDARGQNQRLGWRTRIPPSVFECSTTVVSWFLPILTPT